MNERQVPASDRWWWSAVTLPLPAAALFLYVANEWVFFATKPSVLSVLPIRERVAALFTGGAAFVTGLFVVQVVATAIALFVPRIRAVATIPAGFVLSCLVLMLLDNFTYTIFRFSSVHSPPAMRYAYVLLFMCTAAIAASSLTQRLTEATGKRRGGIMLVVWLLALPALTTGVLEQLRRDSPDRRRPLLASTMASGGTQAIGAPPPNVLLLATDGVPADRMSAYGYAHPTTPFLDSIRDQTLYCENAFSNAGTTYASLLTLLTGQLPTRTKVLYPPTPVQGDAAREHLPGMLRGRGYRTIQLSIRHYADAGDASLIGAFDMANYRWERILGQTRPDARAAKPFAGQMVDRIETRLFAIWGMRQAQDEFRQVTTKRDAGRKFWGDARRVTTLLQFIENSPEPWLAHVHLLDTHIGESPAARGVGDEQFDTTVRAADAWFAKIFAALEAKGQLDRTIIVISSDHGRNWEARERVPLMIRFPGGAHARREQRNVQIADVAPTILDYLGLPVPPHMDGVSLLREQQLRDDRPVFTMLRALPSSSGKTEVDPGPPNYGVTSAAVIVGSQWLALDLEQQTTTTGEVPGHTAAGSKLMVADDARRLLIAELTRSGLRIGPVSPRKVAATTKQASASAE